MADMCMTGEEQKDFCSPQPIAPQGPKYPYGLRITLGPTEIKKLNLQEMPEVDMLFKLAGKVKVVEVSSDEKGEHSLSLQIVDMDLGNDREESDSDASKVLYGVS